MLSCIWRSLRAFAICLQAFLILSSLPTVGLPHSASRHVRRWRFVVVRTVVEIDFAGDDVHGAGSHLVVDPNDVLAQDRDPQRIQRAEKRRRDRDRRPARYGQPVNSLWYKVNAHRPRQTSSETIATE